MKEIQTAILTIISRWLAMVEAQITFFFTVFTLTKPQTLGNSLIQDYLYLVTQHSPVADSLTNALWLGLINFSPDCTMPQQQTYTPLKLHAGEEF